MYLTFYIYIYDEVSIMIDQYWPTSWVYILVELNLHVHKHKIKIIIIQVKHF